MPLCRSFLPELPAWNLSVDHLQFEESGGSQGGDSQRSLQWAAATGREDDLAAMLRDLGT